MDGSYPQVVNHKDSRKTLIVTAGCYGKYIGVLNVTFDSEGKVTNWSGNPVLIDENIPEGELCELSYGIGRFDIFQNYVDYIQLHVLYFYAKLYALFELLQH